MAAEDDELAEVRRARFLEAVELFAGPPRERQRGWQTRAAKSLGLSQPQLSRILAGKEVVGTKVAQRAARALDVPAEWMISRTPLGKLLSGREVAPDGLDDFARPGAANADVARALARSILRQVADRDNAPNPDDALRLATAILTSDFVTLANEVRSAAPEDRGWLGAELATALLRLSS